jgi:hypothetical protein
MSKAEAEHWDGGKAARRGMTSGGRGGECGAMRTEDSEVTERRRDGGPDAGGRSGGEEAEGWRRRRGDPARGLRGGDGPKAPLGGVERRGRTQRRGRRRGPSGGEGGGWENAADGGTGTAPCTPFASLSRGCGSTFKLKALKYTRECCPPPRCASPLVDFEHLREDLPPPQRRRHARARLRASTPF